jgi:hypothetical protein
VIDLLDGESFFVWRRTEPEGPEGEPVNGPGVPGVGLAPGMRSAKRAVLAGPALVQNIRRGHYELAVKEPASLRVAAAFDELALAI